MNIKKLLEYAKVDEERRAEISRFSKIPVVDEYRKKTLIVKKAKAGIEKLNKEAEDLLKQMQSIMNRYSEVLAQLEETEKYIDCIQSESEADFYSKNISSAMAFLDRLTDEAKKVNEKIVSQRTNCSALMSAGKVATKEAKDLQAGYKKEQNNSKQILDEIDQRLLAIAKDIDKEVLEKYKLAVCELKIPPIHILTDHYCRCTMEMPVSVIQKVKSQGWGVCPDCGRILISEEAYNTLK